MLNFTLSSPAAPFSLTSAARTGSFSIAQNAVLTDSVTFNPVIPGTYHDSIVIVSNTDVSTSRIVIRITGVVSSSGGVRESHTLQSFSIVPNPASNNTTLHFTLAEAGEVRAALYDAKGVAIRSFANELYNQGDNSLALNLTGLANGVYYLRLELADGVKTISLVVAK
jgi:hypothetical protein